MTKAKNKNLHTFQFDYTSDRDDERYMGSFTCRKLSIRDLAALGPRTAQLNGGMHYDPANPGMGVDESTHEMNAMIAHLELVVTKSPKWWDLATVSDVSVLAQVYKEVLDFEDSFLRSRRAVREEQADSVTEAHSADSDGGPREMVESEVQSALEP